MPVAGSAPRRIALRYIGRRIALIFPTLIGIMLVNFAIIQAAPGGPVDQAIARITGEGVAVTATIAGGGGVAADPAGQGGYEVSRGMDPIFCRRSNANSASTNRRMCDS